MQRNSSSYRIPVAVAVFALSALPSVLGCASSNELPRIPVPRSEEHEALPAWYPEHPWSAKDGDSRIYIKGRILFDTDKATIRKGAGEKSPTTEEVLMTLLQFINEHPEVTLIRIEGHTDATGSDEHNLDLSARRALTVCDWLVDHNVDNTRLLAVGFGKTKPAAPNGDAEGRQENRRMEFHVAEVKGRPFLTKDPANGGLTLQVKSAEERRAEREAALHPPVVATKAKPHTHHGNEITPIEVNKALQAQAKEAQAKEDAKNEKDAKGGKDAKDGKGSP